MDKQKLIELGLDEAIADIVMDDINSVVGALRQEIQDKEREYAVNRIMDKYEFVSDFAKNAAQNELLAQNFAIENGALSGGGEFMEKFVKDNDYLMKKVNLPPKLMTGTGGSWKNAEWLSGVENEFYKKNPNI